MKVLIVGAGGREHALSWKVAQSASVKTVYVAPGNAGTANEAGVENIDIAVEDIAKLQDFALQESIDLTIVGPEVPLVAGIVDQFQQAGLRIFGPSKAAAQLEGSKSFCKDFLARHNIPTAAYGVFTDLDEAHQYIEKVGAPLVVKADGLAAGKGVVIAHSNTDAKNAVTDMLADNRFGDAGSKVVIEEFLVGTELSFICMVDGKNSLPMATSQDHKARDNGDTGPNTGGMGAYSPAPQANDALQTWVMKKIIAPTVDGMAVDGNTFSGFLYAGLMIADDGSAKVLEYNVRFGDPETQPIMMRLESDLVALCDAAIDGKLDSIEATWSDKAAIGVVMAAGGYPEKYNSGDVIEGLEARHENTKVFHAGTKLEGNDIVTSGGRVLCVTALADTVNQGQRLAYDAVADIKFKDCYYRTDIAHRAVS